MKDSDQAEQLSPSSDGRSLHELIGFERLMADIAARLAQARPGQESEVIDWTLRRLGQFLRAERCFFGELSDDGTALRFSHQWVADGIEDLNLALMSSAPVMSWAAQQIRDNRVIVGGPWLRELPAEAEGLRRLLASQGINSGVVVPVRTEDRSLGFLGFDTIVQPLESPGPFMDRLRIVADMLGSMLQRLEAETSLRATLQRVVHAQEEERRRIARELHDDTTQQLVSLSMDLSLLRSEAGTLSEGTAGELRTLAERARGIADQVHAMARRLHPAVVEDLGLRRALESECDDFERRTGIQVETDLRCGERDELPNTAATALFRIAQESLRNLRKHARTAWARVAVSREDDHVVLRIQDRGAGFAVDQVKTDPGLGLASMRERAKTLGGKLSVVSAPGEGTEIIARLPVPESR